MIKYRNRNNMFESFPKNLVMAELGVFEGEFSKILKTTCSPSLLYLVDMFTGYFGSGDKDGKNHHYVQLEKEMIKIQNYFKEDDNVKVIKSTITDFLNTLEDEILDLVYIDADHSYESVLSDLRLSYNKVKRNGYICGHDYISEAKLAIDNFCLEKKLNIESLSKDGCPSYCIRKK